MLIAGLPTGLIDLDLLTNGLHPGELIVIAGCTGVGKTSLALTVGQYAAIHTQKVVAIFSLGMSEEAIISRMLCSVAHVDANRGAAGLMSKDEWQRIAEATTSLNEAQIFIDDRSFSIAAIRDKAQKLYDEVGLDLLIIDYVQLIPSEHQPFGYRLSRELKQLSKDLAIPIIAVSQLVEAKIDKRSDHRPMLADFGHEASLKQDADVVIFVHREEMYYRTEANAGIAELIVAKHRNGQIGSLKVAFIKEFARFENIWKEGGEKTNDHRIYESIKEAKDLIADIIRHSQEHLIQLRENKNLADIDCRLSIFKSSQEQEFHKAIVEVFPGFTVYPNVSLSCLFEFDKIKRNLTREERNYFFKGVVDCVVFDEDNMPRFFFELDSSHHDNPEQDIKDKYKDNIFSSAGQTLYRIRKIAPDLGQKEFEKLIREVFEPLG